MNEEIDRLVAPACQSILYALQLIKIAFSGITEQTVAVQA